MLNKVMLIGRLGADPEVRFSTKSGEAIATFNMASNEYWYQDGEKKERTEWHRVVSFSKLAETCRDYLCKGSLVYVEGKLRTRTYEDKEGIERSITEIYADSVRFIFTKSKDEAEGGNDEIPF